MKSIQIGVIGSAQNLSLEIKKVAVQLGSEIASKNHTLFFAIEKDSVSLPMLAAKSAVAKGGTAIGIMHTSQKSNWPHTTAEITTGIERAGGREAILINSCDAVISIGGGSGTLMEIAMAYQLNIPIIAINGTRGWSSKLAGTFLDHRKRLKIQKANDPKDAIAKAIKSISLSNHLK